MRTRRLLLLIAVIAAALSGVLAARHRQGPAAAPIPAQGLAVFLDDSGNKVQPTAAQLRGLAPSATQPDKRPAPKVVATDPNNPAMGITLENPPLMTTVARVKADGTVDAGCFEDKAKADAFKATAPAEASK
jgi:hypothetical protein